MDIDLTVRPESREDLPAWYAAALADQASSGLSMAEYAHELGVAPATLHQWKRRLSADDEAEFETPRSTDLIEVEMADAMPDDSGAPFVVRLGGGRQVEVPTWYRDEDLLRLVGLLESC